MVAHKLKCLRCGHEWHPDVAHPVRCPRCTSPYWDKPRRAGIRLYDASGLPTRPLRKSE